MHMTIFLKTTRISMCLNDITYYHMTTKHRSFQAFCKRNLGEFKDGAAHKKLVKVHTTTGAVPGSLQSSYDMFSQQLKRKTIILRDILSGSV